MRPIDDPRSAWHRLEETLLTIKADETISVDALVVETGLGREMIQRVLEELTRTELFEPKGGGVFARRNLWKPASTVHRNTTLGRTGVYGGR
jgi:hypothetical protein